ncbi:hypothetical protein K1719_032564 [Acacia pycnantha]|nr:hypothetical protein K1719_032564 [Acacia pycnantha]
MDEGKVGLNGNKRGRRGCLRWNGRRIKMVDNGGAVHKKNKNNNKMGSSESKTMHSDPVADQLEEDKKMATHKGSIATNWRELSGEHYWKDLIDPLDIDLCRYIIHYEEMAQATYDAFNDEEQS